MSSQAIADALAYGVGVSIAGLDGYTHVPLMDFFWLPEPGERDPWEGKRKFSSHFEGDDGGGAALAYYRFARCG